MNKMNKKEKLKPMSDIVTDEDFSESHPLGVNLEAVREMFPGYKIFTLLEAHEFLRERPDKYSTMEAWNDHVLLNRSREVAN